MGVWVEGRGLDPPCQYIHNHLTDFVEIWNEYSLRTIIWFYGGLAPPKQNLRLDGGGGNSKFIPLTSLTRVAPHGVARGILFSEASECPPDIRTQ